MIFLDNGIQAEIYAVIFPMPIVRKLLKYVIIFEKEC